MKLYCKNGVSIPGPGFGTFNMGDPAEIYGKIVMAAECGYRHFDTGSAYNNEEAVGGGISCVCREICERQELFITGKVSNDDLYHVSDGYYATKSAFSRTLERMRLDYLDLYLIHWPVPRDAEGCWKELNVATWEAMEELYGARKVRAIGLSNFTERHIKNIIQNAKVKPMVNQIEIHPLYQQRSLIEYCTGNDICVEAWGPLKQGEVFKVEKLRKLADKYKKTISQLCLKFCAQLGALPIVKCSTRERMIENLDTAEWEISMEDMEKIRTLDMPDGRYKNYAYRRRDSC